MFGGRPEQKTHSQRAAVPPCLVWGALTQAASCTLHRQPPTYVSTHIQTVLSVYFVKFFLSCFAYLHFLGYRNITCCWSLKLLSCKSDSAEQKLKLQDLWQRLAQCWNKFCIVAAFSPILASSIFSFLSVRKHWQISIFVSADMIPENALEEMTKNMDPNLVIVEAKNGVQMK